MTFPDADPDHRGRKAYLLDLAAAHDKNPIKPAHLIRQKGLSVLYIPFREVTPGILRTTGARPCEQPALPTVWIVTRGRVASIELG
jgi:hypothetical protein